MPIADRFWEKVQKTPECWLWTSTRHPYGYGQFRIGQVYELAHRVAWTLTHGAIPDGLFVCHHCDNPQCVRPDHLFLGTHNDNMTDARRKQRFAHGDRHPASTQPNFVRRGERHHGAKLTERQVRDIRTQHAAGATVRQLACDFHVSNETIRLITTHKAWRHL